MVLKHLLRLLLLPLLLAGFEAQGGEADPQDCTLTHPRLSRVVNARCVDYSVPLDYARPDAGHIRLHVAVIPSTGKNPRPDPLFFFAGGPGQSAVDSALLMWPVFSKVLGHRDIVLIDQRGTGQSTPLNCPDDASRLELAADDEVLRKETAECLEKQSVDVRWFTSRQAVQDVEFVRQTLGYGPMDVMGVSYGTRMAQLVLREYPDKVRSIVIDGILPPQVILGPEFADNLAVSLQKLFLHCAADDYCARTFAALEQDWESYLQLPVDELREFHLTHPRTGKKLDLRVSRQGMDAAVRLLSYASETRALLPLLIHEAAQGDWQGLLGQALQLTDGMEKEMALGMHNSVVCSEDVPFYTEAEPDDNRVLGHMVHQLRIICAEWPRGESYTDIHQPFKTDTPALLLSGELDPVTPVHYGEMALKQFSHGTHLVVPGQGHNVSPRGCVPKLVADFLETLELDEEKAACVQDTSRLPFFIDKLGPGA
ncbi:alpha/beta fold hydrolase [Thiolapillus brandeum]|uniref:AB hydrolase-1 domain-containing protein n=1 Tax=Thiolapillus brandeum TaxID=1076588 RepID=A0A7U6JIN8_9GAMM|nr:alpha/beta fold hydrolase [Thiolapillus brandeum]BAO45729.1 conserved hypothetical protein [Thiolapillus brandeum]